VTVGERCVIAANSVVTSDLPPYSIAAGAPARVLRDWRDAPPAATSS
jgi:acetyltransferase-like isoleucine patch superfamily enzyme